MANNYRLTKNTLTGVTNSGSNSARIHASEAEKKANEALAKAEEALKATTNFNEATILVKELNNKLDAEIKRSTQVDTEHSEQLENIENKINNFAIEFVDLTTESLWESEEK